MWSVLGFLTGECLRGVGVGGCFGVGNRGAWDGKGAAEVGGTEGERREEWEGRMGASKEGKPKQGSGGGTDARSEGRVWRSGPKFGGSGGRALRLDDGGAKGGNEERRGPGGSSGGYNQGWGAGE